MTTKTILGVEMGQKSVTGGADMPQKRSDTTRVGINDENCNFIPNSRCCIVKTTKPISDKEGRGSFKL